MSKIALKGFMQVDGTSASFDENIFENGYIYFVRTSENLDEGYIWFNGKKYGNIEGESSTVIDCGEY